MTATTMANNHKDTTNDKTTTATIATQTKHISNDDDLGMMVLEHASK